MDKYIGSKMKQAREKKGLSLREVSKRINYDNSNLSKIERGTYKATPEIIKKLSDLYEVEPNYFFGDETEVPQELKGLGIEEIIIAQRIRSKNLSQDDFQKIKDFIDGLDK